MKHPWPCIKIGLPRRTLTILSLGCSLRFTQQCAATIVKQFAVLAKAPKWIEPYRIQSFNKAESVRVDIGTKAGVLYPGFNELIWSNYTITRNISLGKPFGSHLLITMPASMYIKTVRGGDGSPLSICTPFSSKEGYYFCGLDERMDTNETQFNYSVEYSVTGVKPQVPGPQCFSSWSDDDLRVTFVSPFIDSKFAW